MHILRLQPKGTGVFTLSVKEARHFPKGKTEGQIRKTGTYCEQWIS